MSTAAAPNVAQAPVSDEVYDPDDVFTRDSPPMEPHYPTLRPVPSPPPRPVSPPPSPGIEKAGCRKRAGSTRGYAILVGLLDGNRQEQAAYHADIEPLTSEIEDTEDAAPDPVSPTGASPGRYSAGGNGDFDRLGGTSRGQTAAQRMRSGSPPDEDMGAFDLKSLAAGALAAVTAPQPEPDAGPTPPVTENDVVSGKPQGTPLPSMAIHTRREGRLKRERDAAPAMLYPFSPHSNYSPPEQGATPLSVKTDMKSPTASIHSSTHGDGLPPIQLNSPKYETNGQTLPSIRSQLGDIPQLGSSHGAGNGLKVTHPAFPGSPAATLPRLPSLHSQMASPSMPSADSYRDPLSPVHPLAAPAPSPVFYYPPANGPRWSHDYASTSPEASSSHQAGSPPAAGLDRVGMDSMTSVIQTIGSYVCNVPGCTALPFQTQYLLNSHANVHSSARPHYCPVPGCPRAEGGKGFKRKNEMIRHGLVHESPGYVCPFCPDRDHRYPRPDNLQRHVRVHHEDKDKDDPQLREVLAQRPDGPSRGRRRRGVTG
ncbi:hypothetical protein N658DRAFT_414860 [Parathielavia hyrcaniae]|uniref:C2H2-type domain-containing protein n=1 Tax=Parathielavia hyrcaniae TaxID=113614 RepID=A0AAN6T710_9PEZI|nr:hypothetical protein N658DRAFT_414860 [Parathielavia hyrcaniae]